MKLKIININDKLEHHYDKIKQDITRIIKIIMTINLIKKFMIINIIKVIILINKFKTIMLI